MGDELTLHLTAQAGDGNVKLTDLSDRLGKMDMQGPMSARVLEKILEDPTTVLSGLGHFSFRGHFKERGLSASSVRLQD
jgi:aminomethyltransferase